MRPIRPERGVTLIELVLTIVIVGIIVAVVTFFVTPLHQASDLAVRAELTDIAGNALQRIGRDVKLALPNSVRRASVGTSVFLEFIAVRTGGRYRADGGGPTGPPGSDCDNDDATLVAPDNDQLSFDLPGGDQCFKTLGKIPGSVVAGSDQLVLNNYGFSDQNAYQTAGTLNRATIIEIDTGEAGRDRIRFTPTTFVRDLHDSPGKRFFIVSGPVTYQCDLATGRLYRHAGYGLSPAQPTSFVGTPALLAQHVVACEFEYTPNVSAQLGLLTMRLRLQRQRFDGSAESVALYHAVHVNNAP
jgi:MSHA biogenesis protein MshO